MPAPAFTPPCRSVRYSRIGWRLAAVASHKAEKLPKPVTLNDLAERVYFPQTKQILIRSLDGEPVD